MDAPPRAPARLPQIDILRGLAAMGVFFFHVTIFPSKVWLPPITAFGRTFAHVPNVVSLGAYGVSLFFVISGFALVLQQWRRGRGASVELRSYARGRVARIVPAYWAAVIFAAGVAAIFGDAGARTIVWHVVLHLPFLHGFDGRAVFSFDTPLWSMVTEVEFYAVFPALLALLARVRAARFVLLAAAFNLAYRIAAAHLPGAHHSLGSLELESLLAMHLPGRILEFALGMTLGDLYLHDRARLRPLAWIALLVGTPLAVISRLGAVTQVVEMSFGVAFFGLLGLLLLRPAGTGRVTSTLAAFGRASYALFLVHFPISVVVRGLIPSLGIFAPHPEPYWTAFYSVVTIFPPSLAAALLLHHYVELPLWERLRAAPAPLSPLLPASRSAP